MIAHPSTPFSLTADISFFLVLAFESSLFIDKERPSRTDLTLFLLRTAPFFLPLSRSLTLFLTDCGSSARRLGAFPLFLQDAEMAFKLDSFVNEAESLSFFSFWIFPLRFSLLFPATRIRISFFRRRSRVVFPRFRYFRPFFLPALRFYF